MNLVRIASLDNFREVEKEWQWEFIFYVLDSIGISEEELKPCLPEDNDFSKFNTKEKIAFREIIAKRDITVVDDRDGGIKIYVYIGELEENILIAEWKKCKFVYREDSTKISPNNKIYIELQANIWTSFENEE